MKWVIIFRLSDDIFMPTYFNKILVIDITNGCDSSFLQMILDAIEQVGGIFLVTADHGNAEDMVKRNKKGEPLLDKNGNIQILTSHTLEPVSNSFNFSNGNLKFILLVPCHHSEITLGTLSLRTLQNQYRYGKKGTCG